MIELLVTFVRFCIVGFSGLGIDFFTTWLLKEKILLNKYFSNSCGFILAASSNYYFNRIWTFNSINPEISKEFSIFLFVSVIGLIINNVLLFIFHKKYENNFYFAKIIAILITAIWNFLGNNFYTFAV
tara:strand:+ start:424 stop:807 length:384 start_codon:yes stop_codon:yes gene_type:complete